MKNDHEVLGVSADADQKEIKKAYFKLVRQFSPEKDPERFQEIRGAYERLQQAEAQEKEGNFPLTMEMPDEPFAHSMMKQIDRLERQGDFEGAAATAKEAVSRFGEYEAFLYELGRSQLYSGHSGSAAKNFEKLVKQYPGKNEYKRNLAIAYFDRGYGKKAFEAFEAAYAAGVRDSDFILQYSMCCRDREEEARGIEILMEMVSGYEPSSKENLQDYLEAYTGIFSLDHFAPSEDYGKFLASYGNFLETAWRTLKEYDDMILELTSFLVMSFHRPDCLPVLEEILTLTKKILPEKKFSEEWKYISEMLLGKRIQVDQRLDQEWNHCFEMYIESNHTDDQSIARFAKLEAKLLLLERWEELAPQFDMMQAEYAELYEWLKELRELSQQSNLSYLMDKLRREYASMARNIDGSLYYDMYPQYKEAGEALQWDSSENGSFVRMEKKVGRNDPCPCGSGKKYKKCCGR